MSPAATESVVDAALDVKTGGARGLWTYRCSPVPKGTALLVPLGTRTVVAYAVGCREVTEAELGFPFSKLRSVLGKVEGLDLPPQLIEALDYAAEEYLCPFSVALGLAIPTGGTERITTQWRLAPHQAAEPLTRLQTEALDAIKAAGGTLTANKKLKESPALLRALRLLAQKGVLETVHSISAPAEKRKAAGLLRLTPDSDRLERFLSREAKRKPAQALTVMRLQAAEGTALSHAEIKALSGVTDQTIRSLVSAELLMPVEEAAVVRAKPPVPNPEQQSAIDAICGTIRSGTHDSFLLFGVTGSGKTEVFLRCAAEALSAGRQVLYLVPEIALAAQAITQLRGRFGDRVAVFHSELTRAERLENWMRVRSGAAPVVLGPRSALFAPLGNLGLIVMDEEHESSYKQEASPRYHTKKVAAKLAQEHGAALVLGSATPSVETFFEAESGICRMLTLSRRAADARLPTVFVDDLADGYRAGKPAILGQLLSEKLEQTLARGEQVILFLNRRAYAPFLLCRDCGHQFKCPRCSVSLSWSRKTGMLRCHHCDHHAKPPDVCPKCSGTRISPFGVGTERVEEAVREQYPGVRVARLDRDVAQRKGALEEVLTSFRSGDTDVLVGTQMVAKGLDFPRVTLVGVIAADVSLNLPDFRAGERTFQLLSQVAGRAGRGAHPGEVVIQTFNPTHIAVECASTHDYRAMYEAMKEEREAAGYPPFTRLVSILFSGESYEDVLMVSKRAGLALAEIEGEVLGPADSALERLNGRWRRHILIKLAPSSSARPVARCLERVDGKGVSITIDADPYSMA